MAWTYDPNILSSSPRDAVRFTIGDTNEIRPLLSNEEIDYLLELHGSVVAIAAWKAAERISIVLGSKADKTVGRLSISYGRQSESFIALAKRLKRDALSIGAPLAGGLGPTTLAETRTDYSTSTANIAPLPEPPDYLYI